MLLLSASCLPRDVNSNTNRPVLKSGRNGPAPLRFFASPARARSLASPPDSSSLYMLRVSCDKLSGASGVLPVSPSPWLTKP